MGDGWPIIDMKKFPNEAISGLSLSQINEIMSEDPIFTDMDEHFGTFFDDINNINNTIPDIPEDIVSVLNETENNMKPMSSAKQEKQHTEKLISFLSEKNLQCDLKTIEEERLNNYLRYFYHELRTKNGRFYSPTSLKCIRAGIHRHINQTLNRKIDIINGDNFASSNRMLKTMAGLWLSHGGESTQYDKIEDQDLEKIFSSFRRTNGEELQNEVIFSLLYYLGARGREDLRRIKRSDLTFELDSNGAKYAYLKTKKDDASEPNNVRKNVKASLKENDYKNLKNNRIYDSQAVECLEIYLNRLKHDAPDSDNLFHRPVRGNTSKQCFYSSKQVRGVNFLGDFMKKLSKRLKLSKDYTNHCVRCTTVSRAKESGMSNSDVCLITGHKDQRSVDRYDRPSDSRRRAITSVLNLNSLHQQSASTSSMLDQSTTNLTIQAIPEKKMKITVDGNKNTIEFDFS